MIDQPQVFISYQRTDGEFALQVREHLAAAGVRTWMDQYDIPVGAYWPDEIDRGLAASDIVVGILSPDAVESRNVKNEWDWAIQNAKPLLLLQVQPCIIPHRYVSINFIDATASDRAPALDALLRTLNGRASGLTVESPTVAVPPHHRPRRMTRTFPTEPRLVGRQREQEQMRLLLDRLRAGTGSVLLIGGEAGIGKTALVNWLGWAAEEQGALVVSGGCYDLSITPPYGPWVEIIDRWPQQPALPPVPEVLQGSGIGRLQSQAELFAAAGTFLSAAGNVRPLVVLLEDLHWADRASLDLLHFMTRHVGHTRVLLVATYRSDELHQRHPLQLLLPALIREADATRLELGALSAEAIRALVEANYALPRGDLNRLTAWLQQHAEGHALYTSELLRMLVDEGVLTQATDGRWTLADLGLVRVPSLVREVIDARLARLPDDVQAALAVASVVGAEVPVELWAAVAGSDEERLLETIERGVESRLLTMTPDGTIVRFSHALIRAALYESVLPLRRRIQHRRVAELLAEDRLPNPDAVAHHFEQAGDARAVDWLIRAGNRAEFGWATAGAIERFERAAQLSDDTSLRGWLLLRLSRLYRFFDIARGMENLTLANQLAVQSGDVLLEGMIDYVIGQLDMFSGRGRQGLARLGRGVTNIERLLAEGRELPIHLLDREMRLYPQLQFDEIGRIVISPGRPLYASQAATHGPLDEGLQRLKQLADEIAASDALSQTTRNSLTRELLAPTVVAHALRGEVDAALDVHRRWETDEGSTRSAMWLWWRLNGQTYALIILYRPTDLAARQRISTTTSDAWQNLGGVYRVPPALHLMLLDGRWEALRTAIDDPSLEPWICWLRSGIAVTLERLQGNIQAAWDAARREFPHGTDTAPGDVWVFTILGLAAVADLALDCDDVTDARHWIDAVERFIDYHRATAYRPLLSLLEARLARVSGDTIAASRHARSALEQASRPEQPLQLLAARRLLGELATAGEQFDSAHEHLQQALALAGACAAPFERALTLVAQAELALATGDDAAALLGEARQICERLGARPTLERITALEAELP
jgi:tetratricopeptide (TPR) repeat protein